MLKGYTKSVGLDGREVNNLLAFAKRGRSIVSTINSSNLDSIHNTVY